MHLIEDAGRPLDDIEMTESDGVERPGDDGDPAHASRLMGATTLHPNGGWRPRQGLRETRIMRGLRVIVMTAVAAIVVATSLSGCAALGVVLAPGGMLGTLGSVPPPSVEHYSDGSTTERDNIPKVVGQKAGILSED